MKASCFLLVALVLIISVPHPEATRATDLVQITGYVHDVEGRPVEGVSIDAWSLTPPWVSYGRVETDSKGHYVLSFDRPKRLDSPVPSNNGRPIYEGCEILVAWGSKEWMGFFCRVNTEKKNCIEQDFILKPAGAVKLKAYSQDGTLIEKFPEPDTSIKDPTYPVYATDFYWKVTSTQFIADLGVIVLSLNTPNVINFPWNVPGFGKVILRADNDGKGFILTKQGETITINLNYELARTECRLVRESYERYLGEAYIFSENLSLNIQSASELLQKADSAGGDAQKAHFSDLCLNRTLWAAESLELEKALQDIERYRKGNVTITLVDESGKPIEGAQIGITQITHDFLFGANPDGPEVDLEAYRLLMQAGINFGHFEFCWWNTERPLGQYRFDDLPPYLYKSLSDMGLGLEGGCLFMLEANPNTYDTGLVNLNFEQLRTKVYEHVHRVVSEYSGYIDYWTIAHNVNRQYDTLGFSQPQVLDLIKTAIEAVRAADPGSKILLYFDDPGGDKTRPDDTSAYTFFSELDENGIHLDGISVGVEYGSLYEFPGGFWLGGAIQVPMPFRDLASISRIFDWYSTLSLPIYVEVHVPANFTSNLGYWHRRSWDEGLQAEWVEKFYTIAFSKSWMREITYYAVVDKDYQRAGRGLLDEHHTPRESFYMLKRLITEDWTTRLQMKTDSNGQLEFRGFAGDYNITVSTKDFTVNFTIHLDEQTSNTYTINLGGAIARSKSEQAVTKAGEAVSRAKAEGRTIYLDRAENLLEDARKALIEENYTQAILLAEEAKRSADLAITWLVIPVIIAFAGGILSCSMILYRRAQAKRQKPIAP